MPLSGYVIEGRTHLLARIKLIFDLLLAAGLYVSGAPMIALLAPAADVLLLLLCLRVVKRSPALAVFAMLAGWAALLALAPLALGMRGLALWPLFVLIPASAGFVLGRRALLWQVAVVTAGVLAFGLFLVLQSNQPLGFDEIALGVLAGATLASILLATWLMERVLRAESGSRDMLGQPIAVVRGVLVAPLNQAVGGVQVDRLREELNELKRQHNPRWVVLDLAPAGTIGRHDLHAVEQAAEEASSRSCPVVLARSPVDAIGHLDLAQPAVGRVERFATVAQAVEAGLRRLGWTTGADQGQRVVTTY